MSIQLTFTQCKQIKENGYDLAEALEKLNDQPAFISEVQPLESISGFQAIMQGGCASGAYMPAVTYGTALETMTDHSDSIETILEEACDAALIWTVADDTFAAFCVNCVSLAVEYWVLGFADMLDGVDWD